MRLRPFTIALRGLCAIENPATQLIFGNFVIHNYFHLNEHLLLGKIRMFKWLNNPLRCVLWKTNSSPQWWSDSLMTAQILLNLRSPVWGFGESCTIVHGITSHPANVFSNVPYWYFRLSLTVWLQYEGDFLTPTLGRTLGANSRSIR